jgi:hypothetical protein
MPNYFSAARFYQAINAPGSDETDPAVSPHSDYLYFTSNRKGGLGGFDLYRARIATRVPAACEHLGPEINGAGDDVGPDVWMQGFGLFFSKTPDSGSRAFELYGAMSRCVWPQYDTTRKIDWPWLRAHYPQRLKLAAAALVAGLVSILLAAWRRKKRSDGMRARHSAQENRN